MKPKLYKHYKKELDNKFSFLFGQKAFIVNSRGKVLIIRRHEKSTQGKMWDFPGGRVNFGENLRIALEREVEEESGLKLSRISTPLSVSSFLREIDRNTQIIRTIYLCKAKGRVVLSKEHVEGCWINVEDFKKYRFISEDYYQAFENYLKFKPKGNEFLNKGMLGESLKYLKAHK